MLLKSKKVGKLYVKASGPHIFMEYVGQSRFTARVSTPKGGI